MKKTRNILLTELVASVIIALAIVISFECEWAMPGALQGNDSAQFWVLTIMELFTICAIPLSLRLFKFNLVATQLKTLREKALLIWGSVRMALLCLPLIGNMLFYYLFGFKVGFAYMGIIAFVCLIFINPSMKRCLAETGEE